jgi:hypothetical protein
MATCKDCVHIEVCKDYIKTVLDDFDDSQMCGDDCEFFQDRSRFVELPDVGDYDTVTNIDEAIDHCYQIATSADENVCAECKAEHMRLCGWLGDLKRRIAAEQALKERENNE